MTATRRPVSKILSVAFCLLGLNGWAQVLSAALGRSSDSLVLTALQFLIGLAGIATAWGGWQRAQWTWKAAIAYGVVTGGMLVALPFLLGLPAEERAGIWSGAAVIMVFALLCAWYFRSDARRQVGVASSAQVRES